MSNFNINLIYPWLLTLLIPAFALALYTFFKVNKKFRYTRNRIISIIMCSLCIICSVLMICGTTLSYDKANEDNEVIVLVDSSYSNNESKEAKDSFVYSLIENNDKNTKLGIINFGYNQVYAVELTKDLEDAYDRYLESPAVVDTATNIQRAIDFAYNQFTNPKLGKIVLITDGIETDGESLKAVEEIAMSGVKVDVAKFGNDKVKNEVMPLEIVLPESAILTTEQTQIEVKIESSVRADVLITMEDNGVNAGSQFVGVKQGINSVFFKYQFRDFGVHEIAFKISSSSDTLEENNVLYAYVNIEKVDRILILQRKDEGVIPRDILKEDNKVTLKNIKDAPDNLDDLRDFDQIILANIANNDMPLGLDELLNQYVSEIGGSLFTIGGVREENGREVANVYNREDMKDTLYQDMIPVLAEDYRPPIAVVLVVDVSGSMQEVPEGWDKTLMDQAKESAKVGLRALDNRDYLGIVTFGDTASTVLDPTPVVRRREIENAIDRIQWAMEGTIYTNGLEKAGLMLKSVSGVNKKHIIVISDGEPSGGDTRYNETTIANYESGVTTSTISYFIGGVGSALSQVASYGHGRCWEAMFGADLENAIRSDIQAPEIKEYEFKTFKPVIGDNSYIFEGVNEEDIPELHGFFGTKLKRDAVALMKGEYGEPIYAEWKYGQGKVGSFMCDLNGKWSSNFVSDLNGKKIINNICKGLFPIESIKKDRIELDSYIKNSEVKTNIVSNYNEGEYLKAIVSKIDVSNFEKSIVHSIDIDNFKGNINITYDLLESGLYELEVLKFNKDGDVIDKNIIYHTFSYSKEYDPFLNEINNDEFINSLVQKGNGRVIEEGYEAYEDLIKSFHRVYDIRYICASIIIICILIDIAVRKFKFKWLHEIIIDKKKDKKVKSGNTQL